jgi:Sec-independent protein translocase protein TatA
MLGHIISMLATNPPFEDTILQDLAILAIHSAGTVIKSARKIMKTVVSEVQREVNAHNNNNDNNNRTTTTTTAQHTPGHHPPPHHSSTSSAAASSSSLLNNINRHHSYSEVMPQQQGGDAGETHSPYHAPPKNNDVTATDNATECVVCLTNQRAAFFIPCGHIVCCMSCGQGLKQCCVCRAPVQQVLKAFL